MNRFKNKVALITGGRSGIGKAVAYHLRNEGVRVFTAQRGKDEEFEGIKTDLADPSGPEKAVLEVIARAGQLDILVNSAGIMQEVSVEKMSLEEWQKTLNLNLTAPFLTIRAALPFLRKSRGSIVNIGSIEGIGANPKHSAYCASKAGLHGLTRAVAVDHGYEGIRCNAVAPGWIDTELNSNLINSKADPSKYKSQLNEIHPISRTGKPEDVAALVVFLASDDAGFITGQVYPVDGGRMARLSSPQPEDI